MPLDHNDTSVQAPTSQELENLQLKPKRWPLLLGLVAVLAVVVGVAAFMMTRDHREPQRVLLAIDVDGYFWHGSTSAAKIVDELNPQLEKRGFVLVGAGDPSEWERLADADTPEEAAKIAGAAFIVTGKLEPQLTQHDSAGTEVKLIGELSLQHYQGEPTSIGRVATWAFARDKNEAMQLAAESAAVTVHNNVLKGLMAHEVLQKILHGEDALARGKLTSAKAYLDKWNENVERVTGEYEKLAQEHTAGERGKNKVTFHGSFDQRATLAAVTPRGALVKTDEVKTYFSPEQEALLHKSDFDRLYWVNPGKDPELILEAIDLYGYPSASRDGNVVACVEALLSDHTALHVVHGSTAKRLLVSSDQLSEPKVSPQGTRVAMWHRRCGTCPAALQVVGSKDGKQQAGTDAEEGSLAGFTWLTEKTLAFVYRPKSGCGYAAECEDQPGPPRQQLVLLDLSAASPSYSVLYTAASDESLQFPTASADGSRVLMFRRVYYEQGLAILDRTPRENGEEPQLQLFDAGSVREPAISPDGQRAVFVRGGNIAVFDFASLSTHNLTRNQESDRYPLFSHDGRRVYFERRDDDPAFSKRQVSVVASVDAL